MDRGTRACYLSIDVVISNWRERQIARSNKMIVKTFPPRLRVSGIRGGGGVEGKEREENEEGERDGDGSKQELFLNFERPRLC